jgi:3',5'-cyclic-AMP phosphodiesterase
MYITSITLQPIHQIPFIAPPSNAFGVGNQMLPVLSAQVDYLPPGLEAIIATSDLQGIDPNNQRLLGHLVANELENLAEQGHIPSPEKTGIILAGDFYAQKEKRGGDGDVREVWQAFNRCFRWVAGVAGNHDHFGKTLEEINIFKTELGINYLDEEITCIDEISIAGIAGIIGNKTKHFRRSEKDFIQAIQELVSQSPNILILHEGPNHPEAKLKGNESIRVELATASNLLVICGHSHWNVPVTTLSQEVQVLNVDSRVVVMKAQ